MIIPRAEPFYFPGNDIGCLLIHGFTGAPTEMRPLGDYLASQGYSVLGIRLFGHGTRLEDMNRSRWKDWVACVEDGWHLLQGSADQIFIIGLSMGGVLALYNASRFPFQGVVALSTPYKLDMDPRLENIEKLFQEIPFVDKGESDWFDPEAEKGHISYSRYQLRGVFELYQVVKEMQNVLPEVRIPALLVQSKNDSLVTSENVDAIFSGISTPEEDKEMIWLEKSGHVITRDAAKERVFEEVGRFLAKYSHTQE